MGSLNRDGKRPDYTQILAWLTNEFERRPLEECDFHRLLQELQEQLESSEEELLRHGFRRAYRQLVEGV
jgi:hypothetical protein